MGGLFKANTPAPIPVPAVPVLPPAANPPVMANSQVAQSGASQRSRAAAAAASGFDGTVTNSGGPAGLTQQTPTAPATLLGA